MNMKGVILGVAGVLGVTGAQAADLPAAPEPVDYVRVCDAFGAGFLYVPGTETCFRIRGRVRADYATAFWGPKGISSMSWNKNDKPGYYFRARAYLYSDSRTNTEFGLLRTYSEVFFTQDTRFNGDTGGLTTSIDTAFIQFGGLTAGKYYSFFNYYTTPILFGQFEPAHSDYNTLGIAYTFAFGNGFSASLSLEDATFSKGGILGADQSKAKMPDIVANIRVDQGWGSAQIMGALHEVRTLKGNGVDSGNELGWGIGAGTMINLPMLGEGDELGLQTVYAQGYQAGTAPNPWGTGADARIDGKGKLQLAHSWSIAAGLNHFWTPQISSGLGVSYLTVWNLGKKNNFDNWDIQGNIKYTPVAGLLFAGELEYKLKTPERRGADTKDALIGMFRIQRDF